MPEGEIRVSGLRELHRALKRYNTDLKRELEDRLKDAGEIVAEGARSLFGGIDPRSAAGFRPKVRGFGRVVVQQQLRKKTGLRPDYGSLQMRRALLPAVSESEPRVMAAMEEMLNDLGKGFDQ